MRNDVVGNALSTQFAAKAARNVSKITVIASGEDRILRAYLGGTDSALNFAPHERPTTAGVVDEPPHAIVLQLDCPEQVWLADLLQLRRQSTDVPIVARSVGVAFDSLVLLASFGVRGHVYDVSSRWRHVQAVRIVSNGGVAWSLCDLRKALFVLETDGFLPTLRRIQKLARSLFEPKDAIAAAGVCVADDVAAIAKQMLNVAVTPVQRGIVLDWQAHVQNLFAASAD